MTKNGKKSAAFIICVEKGILEYKSLCLVLSLRKYGGRWAGLPIYAYSPRSGRGISHWLSEIFCEYGVTQISEILNKEFSDYPLANKPICMADAERRLGDKFLIFLDSDIFCWGEPYELELKDGIDLRMVPDSTKTVASAGQGDRFEEMWQSLYEITQAKYEPYSITLLTNKKVRGWWSSGVVVCRRSARLMTRWMDCLKSCMKNRFFPEEAKYLIEQCALCAVAAAVYDRFSELPVKYNYNIQNWEFYSRRNCPPEEAVFWHYQQYFNKTFKTFAIAINKYSNKVEKINLAENFIERIKTDYPNMLGIDENWLTCLRRRLMLGIKLRRFLSISKDSDLMITDKDYR